MIVTAILTARTMKGYAAKAEQIVLAAAVFDRHGRILVSPEGLLPSEKITETFPQKVVRTFLDPFASRTNTDRWRV